MNEMMEAELTERAGMLNTKRSFRRVKGAKDMPTLLAALGHHVDQLSDEVHDDTRLAA